MVTLPSWWYKGSLIYSTEDMPKDTYGFIYEVHHKPSDRKYIGKKVLYFERNKRLGKKALEALRLERKAKDIVKLIKENKQMEFERKILEFVPNKKLLTYYECKYLFINEVLEAHNNYINDNILGKFYKKDFLNDKN